MHDDVHLGPGVGPGVGPGARGRLQPGAQRFGQDVGGLHAQDVGRQPVPQHLRQRPAHDLLRAAAQEVRGGPGGHDDPLVPAVDGQQEPVRLDRPRHVDGLAVAVGEVDLAVDRDVRADLAHGTGSASGASHDR